MNPASIRLRFTMVDPHSENYYSWSPYVYVANNPMKFIDPDGRSILGTDGKPVSFSKEKGWSNNTSIDVMIVGGSMMRSKTATKHLNRMLNSSKDIS